MAEPKVFEPEVLPPEAQQLHPYNKPVQFNMANTLQSPLFWMGVGAAVMFGLHHYFTSRKKD